MKLPSLHFPFGWFKKDSAQEENTRKGKETNKKINAEITREKETYQTTRRILLMGLEQSGKSTVIKQMKILHTEGFSESEKKLKASEVRKNVMDAILSTMEGIRTLVPPVQLEHPENQLMLDYIKDLSTLLTGSDTDYPPEFYENVEELWKDPGFQEGCKRSNEHVLFNSAAYFLDKIQDIKQSNYVPTDEDILRCRARTIGIAEARFNVNDLSFHMFDGARVDGYRWIRLMYGYFNKLTAIVYVIDCSSFDIMLPEDPSQNQLKESIEMFKGFWNNRHLHLFYRDIKGVVLLLNKQDVLAEKIKSGRTKLEDFFPWFALYQTPIDAETEVGEDAEYVRAKYFILDEFLRVTTRNWYSYYNCCSQFTCAVDSKNVRLVFNKLLDQWQI